MELNVRALRERAPGGESLRRHDEVARLLTGSETATAGDGIAWCATCAANFGYRRCELTESA